MVIEPYSLKYAEAHEVFAAKMWPHKGRRRNGYYNRWKFRAHDDVQCGGLLLARNGENVVGQLGLIPVVIEQDGEFHEAQWACDLMVDSSLRGQGIASSLFSEGMKMKAVTLGSNPSPGAYATMTKMGFALVRGPYQLIRADKPAFVAHAFHHDRYSRIYPLLHRVGRWFSTTYQNDSTILRARYGEDVCYEQLHTKSHEVSGCASVVHDKQYYQWRCMGLENFNNPGSVWLNTGGHLIANLDGNTWHISEFAYSTTHDAKALLGAFLADANDQGVQLIYSYANSAREALMLARTGFAPLPRPVRIMYYSQVHGMSVPRCFHYNGLDSDDRL